jgi:rhodanese-related sulfurtransferase
MDGRGRLSISAQAVYTYLGTASAPILLDVRNAPTFDADAALIVGAVRRSPEDVDSWAHGLVTGRPLVIYCDDGQQVSPGIAERLAADGTNARYLQGGISAWRELGLPTRRRIGPTPGHWVTRERPKVDRIACPWLIRRFVDPEAEFHYVPSTAVWEVAAERGGTPFDIAGAEFGHVGEACSFDAFIRIFEIRDAGLDRLALIVRGADTGRPDLTPQSPGLLALAQGLSDNFLDDHAMLEAGMIVYDALYTWCRRQEASAAA